MRNLIAASVLGALLLAGCGSDSSTETSVVDNSPTLKTGQFIDSAVTGMDYSCIGTDNNFSGITNIDGEFLYKDGYDCTFSVGDTVLGELIMDGEIVTPNDLTDNNDVFVNMLRLLQTLDVDGNPDNGIVLPTEVYGSIDLTNFDAEIEAYLALNNNSNVVVSVEEALQHFSDSITAQFTGYII